MLDTIDNTQITLRTNALTTASNVPIYLSEISECNATLVNSDDTNINIDIRGLAIQYYSGRLWVGTSRGIYYSQIGKYNGWDIKYDAGVLDSTFNDSATVKALGLYSSYMLVHREYYTYLLSCTGNSDTISIEPYSSISCDSQQSFVVSNSKYYVYSKENMGIYPLTQRTMFSDKYIGDELSVKVRKIFKNIRQEETDKIFTVSYPKNRWFIFYLPLNDKEGSGYG